MNQQYKIGVNYLFTKYLTNHTEFTYTQFDNLITNYVIKENVPSGRNRYDGLLHKGKGAGLSERAGRQEQRRSCAIVNTVSYAF